MIDVSVVHWLMLDNGWTFMDRPGVIPDPLYGARFLYEIYTRAEPRYAGRVTVPVLWEGDQDHLERRVLRNHPDVQLGLRCLWWPVSNKSETGFCRIGSGQSRVCRRFGQRTCEPTKFWNWSISLSSV